MSAYFNGIFSLAKKCVCFFCSCNKVLGRSDFPRSKSALVANSLSYCFKCIYFINWSLFEQSTKYTRNSICNSVKHLNRIWLDDTVSIRKRILIYNIRTNRKQSHKQPKTRTKPNQTKSTSQMEKGKNQSKLAFMIVCVLVLFCIEITAAKTFVFYLSIQEKYSTNVKFLHAIHVPHVSHCTNKNNKQGKIRENS